MAEHDDSLFAEENRNREVEKLLSGDIRGRISIAYVGAALEKGRMDAVALADGLKGTARFVNRVAEMHLGSSDGFLFEVEGEPRAGSLEVFIRLSHVLVTSIISAVDSKLLSRLVIISSLCGFTLRDAGKSLISIFKKLHGRPITNETNLDLLIPDDTPIEKAEFIRIYNDPEVQAAIRAAIRPLRKEGIERFETRVDRKEIEYVTKSDVEAADSAELDAIISDEEKVLDIEKASFVPHLSWHLSDRGQPFDARIEDPVLWREVETGKRFGYGDRLHVTLHTEAERESNGRLKISRTVTKVHKIERAGANQTEMFGESVDEEGTD